MWRTVLILYTFVILCSGVYGSVFVAHSHWEYVVWAPPLSEIRTIAFWFDVLANIALYAPFAIIFLQYKHSAQTSALILPIMLAFLLSSTVELYQVYSHNRRPSPIDLLCNVSGALIGALLWNISRSRLRFVAGPKSPTIPIR